MQKRRFVFGLVGALFLLLAASAVNLLTGLVDDPFTPMGLLILGGIAISGTIGGAWYSTHVQDDIPSAGIRAKGITSREGGLLADDLTGRGIDVEKIKTKGDIILSTQSDRRDNDPKDTPSP